MIFKGMEIFLGIYVGKKLGICTRQDLRNIGILKLTMTLITAIEILAAEIKAIETLR